MIPAHEDFGHCGGKVGDLAAWLEECALARGKGEPLPSWVFFPEEAAGPDSVFWVQIGTATHLVFLQARLQTSVVDWTAAAAAVYRTTIPESSYVELSDGEYRLSTELHTECNRRVRTVARSTIVASVIRVVVAFPAPVQQLSTGFPAPRCEKVDQGCQPHDDDVKDLLIVMRGGGGGQVIAGKANNAGLLFTKEPLMFMNAR
jgi:hypothetical protein